MYKALVTDLDGTSVPVGSNGDGIDKKIRYLLQKASKAGYKITCATGRDWNLGRSVIESLGFTSACIIDGGTRIVNPKNGETIWEKYLADGAPEKILATFKKYATSGIYISSTVMSRPEVTQAISIGAKERFMYLLAQEEALAIQIANEINNVGSAVAHLTPSWYGQKLYDIHVTHIQGTKEHAIKVWQTIEGVHKNETIGMGDSDNDVPIFLASGFKVAVARATPNLLELADYIVPENTTDALYHVIEKFLFKGQAHQTNMQ